MHCSAVLHQGWQVDLQILPYLLSPLFNVFCSALLSLCCAVGDVGPGDGMPGTGVIINVRCNML